MIRRRASAALIAAALHSQMREKRPADGIGKFDGSAAKRLIISFLKCLNIDLRKRLKSEDHRFLRKAPPNGILSEPARMGGDSYRCDRPVGVQCELRRASMHLGHFTQLNRCAGAFRKNHERDAAGKFCFQKNECFGTGVVGDVAGSQNGGSRKPILEERCY